MQYVQYIIVGLVILTAVAYAGRSLYLRTRSFTAKPDCEADCGCGGKSKKLSS